MAMSENDKTEVFDKLTVHGEDIKELKTNYEWIKSNLEKIEKLLNRFIIFIGITVIGFIIMFIFNNAGKVVK